MHCKVLFSGRIVEKARSFSACVCTHPRSLIKSSRVSKKISKDTAAVRKYFYTKANYGILQNMNYNSTVLFLLNEDCSMVVALSASGMVQRANNTASYHDSFLLIAVQLIQNDLVSHNVS